MGKRVRQRTTRPIRPDRGINVGTAERIASGIAGAALALAALRGRRLRGVLLPVGGGLLWRAITGRCAVNRALGRNSARKDTISPVASLERGAGIKIEKSVVVNRPREELYRFWRNFENLPRFMDHLESVTIIDENRSHWVVKGPMGMRVEWDAEIHNEIPNELIAWRTLAGSEVNHAGSVHFEPLLPGPGTTVRVILRYEPPAGKPGARSPRCSVRSRRSRSRMISAGSSRSWRRAKLASTAEDRRRLTDDGPLRLPDRRGRAGGAERRVDPGPLPPSRARLRRRGTPQRPRRGNPRRPDARRYRARRVPTPGARRARAIRGRGPPLCRGHRRSLPRRRLRDRLS